MNFVTTSPSPAKIGPNLFDVLKELLLIKPVFLLGIILVTVAILLLFHRNKSKCTRILVFSVLMYYYLCFMFVNIVGIPSLHEYTRLAQLGESIFHPNINLIPFNDGFSFSFLLNILLFIPLGFLCPLISKTFLNKKNICLIGFGLSFFIEIAQLFTLHRATDINDLFANVFGTIIGYFFLQLTAKLPIIKSLCSNSPTEKCTTYLPATIITISFVLSFLA